MQNRYKTHKNNKKWITRPNTSLILYYERQSLISLNQFTFAYNCNFFTISALENNPQYSRKQNWDSKQ